MGCWRWSRAALASVEQVRLAKSRSGDMAHSPIRPAREAYILRRLIREADGRVPPALCVRLWRALIATATLQQAKVGIHMTGALFADAGARTLISRAFRRGRSREPCRYRVGAGLPRRA